MSKKKKAPTKEPQAELSLPRWFPAASPANKPLTVETSGTSGRVEDKKTEASPLPQEETSERPEPSDNMPGEYAWLKRPGVEKGDVMRPDLKKGKK